jgi:hypothetical protein
MPFAATAGGTDPMAAAGTAAPLRDNAAIAQMLREMAGLLEA